MPLIQMSMYTLPRVVVRRTFCTASPQISSFNEDYNANFINSSLLQKRLLGVGSALVSILNPYRADMIATCSETTGQKALRNMLQKMLQSEEGCEILKDKPRLNTNTIDLKKLSEMPDNTLGKAYYMFLKNNNVTPDSRDSVQFIDDINHAYVIQRYREAHDLFHTILEMPTHMLGEVTVKWVEAIQTTLPMCIGAAILGPIRLKPKHRKMYRELYLPWAIQTGSNSSFLLNLYFEKRWDQPLDELHKEVGIKPFKLPEQK